MEGSGADGTLMRTVWYIETPPDFQVPGLVLPEELLTDYPNVEIDGLLYEESRLMYPVNTTAPRSFDALTIRPD